MKLFICALLFPFLFWLNMRTRVSFVCVRVFVHVLISMLMTEISEFVPFQGCEYVLCLCAGTSKEKKFRSFGATCTRV